MARRLKADDQSAKLSNAAEPLRHMNHMNLTQTMSAPGDATCIESQPVRHSHKNATPNTMSASGRGLRNAPRQLNLLETKNVEVQLHVPREPNTP